jgi:hypothetical protein
MNYLLSANERAWQWYAGLSFFWGLLATLALVTPILVGINTRMEMPLWLRGCLIGTTILFMVSKFLATSAVVAKLRKGRL